MANLGTCVPIGVRQMEEAIIFAQENKIELTIVGPEVPLVDGWVDAFEEAGLRIFGPRQRAAALEGSKVFAKRFMEQYAIPTASHRSFSSEQYAEAAAYIKHNPGPLVLKADGLAAGKGVLICRDTEEALEGLRSIMVEAQFGQAGASVVIEEFMVGEEVSVFVLTDGVRYVTLTPSQDHKRIGDGDTGLNTGGMGTYAPAPVATTTLMDEVDKQIIMPTLEGMRRENRTFQGFLYIGLMVTKAGPKVVEYNCRFGDPEAQVVLPLLQDDLLSLIIDLLDGKPIPKTATTKEGAAACVIMASGGYPETYNKGYPITGILEAESLEGVVVYHAGTAIRDRELVTNGGRVLGVTAMGKDLQEALDKAYEGVACIHFDGAQYRKDIGQKGLKWLGV